MNVIDRSVNKFLFDETKTLEKKVKKLQEQNDKLKDMIQAKNIEESFLRSEIMSLKQQLKEAVEAIEYLYPNIDAMFRDIPEGLSPMSYHTLSYRGDMKVRERLDGIANFIAKYRGGMSDLKNNLEEVL